MPTPGSPALCQGDSAVHPNTTLFVNHASRRRCDLADHTDRADKDESRPLRHWLRRSCGFAPKNQPALTRCTDQQRSILTDPGSAESPPCLTLPAQTPWPGGSTVQPLPSESEVTPPLARLLFFREVPPSLVPVHTSPQTSLDLQLEASLPGSGGLSQQMKN